MVFVWTMWFSLLAKRRMSEYIKSVCPLLRSFNTLNVKIYEWFYFYICVLCAFFVYPHFVFKIHVYILYLILFQNFRSIFHVHISIEYSACALHIEFLNLHCIFTYGFVILTCFIYLLKLHLKRMFCLVYLKIWN